MGETFRVLHGDGADHAQSAQWAELINQLVLMLLPSEIERPGAQSLMCYALMNVGAMMLGRCPPSDRGAALEAMQNYLASGTHYYGGLRDAANKERGGE